MHRPRTRLTGLPTPPVADERGARGQVLRLDEELAEGRVGEVRGRRRQDDLRVARDVDLANAGAVIGHRHPPHLDVVLGRDRHIEPRRHRAVPALERRALRQKGDRVVVGLPVHWMVRRGPGRTAPDVAQVDELAARVARRVVARPRHRETAPEAGAAAGVGHDRDVGAVREELRVRKDGVRRPIAPDRDGGQGRGHPHLVERPRLGRRRSARHALLQQQLGRLHPRVRVEPLHHRVAEQSVRQRNEGHALVMRQTGTDDRAPEASRLARFTLVTLGVAVRVVDGVVEAVLALETRGGQPPQVGGALHRIDHRGQGRRVGRHHQLVAQATLQAEAGDAEGLVLIGVVPVHEIVGRLRDAPRHAAGGRVVDLAADDHAAGFVEERLRVAAHQEQRQQVLEHRSVPRQQHGPAPDAGDGAPQMEPVQLGNVAFRNGDEARQARFGGQEVVVGVVQAARPFGVGEAIADREEVPPRVVEEPEAHAVEQRRRARRRPLEARAVLRRGGAVGQPPQPDGEREERGREVAAVHRGHVARAAAAPACACRTSSAGGPRTGPGSRRCRASSRSGRRDHRGR